MDSKKPLKSYKKWGFGKKLAKISGGPMISQAGRGETNTRGSAPTREILDPSTDNISEKQVSEYIYLECEMCGRS